MDNGVKISNLSAAVITSSNITDNIGHGVDNSSTATINNNVIRDNLGDGVNNNGWDIANMTNNNIINKLWKWYN